MPRILTLNTYLLDVRLFGWLRVYPAAPYVEERLAVLPSALADSGADILCLQEVYRRPHRAYLAAALKDVYPHAVGIDHPGMPLGTGLMVLSRHPIVSARPHEFRAAFVEERLAIRMGMLECMIRDPDIGSYRAIDFHLAAGGLFGHPEGRRGEQCRTRQIGELIDLARQSVEMPTIVAGNLNAGPHTSTANYRQILAAGFVDAASATENTGDSAEHPLHTWDPANPMITGAANRALPPQRIDHVFLGRQGGERLRIGEARVVLDDARVNTGGGGDGHRLPVSDHYGLVADITF